MRFCILVVCAGLLPADVATAQTPFRACEATAISQLDDGISPADVIAAGVAQYCMSAAPDSACSNQRCTDATYAFLKRSILPDILRARVAARAKVH